MARYIDVDALKAAMKAVKSGPDIALSTYLIRIIAKILDGAPTVDAIPVEWLEKHRTEYFEDWGKEPVTIDRALILWQKEQEEEK